MATAVSKDIGIKGISVANVECKLRQYANDTTMILDGSQASLQRFLALVDRFGQLSGIRVNFEKTEAFWIGSQKGSYHIRCPEKKIQWAEGKVKALRVWFCTDQNEGLRLNDENRIHNVRIF